MSTVDLVSFCEFCMSFGEFFGFVVGVQFMIVLWILAVEGVFYA